ncbi:MAG: FAD-dependent oxidoreductase, partial [Rickettsiales bacterium]
FGVTQAGCPLEEKVSEMHELKARGVAIGALAMAVVDNPMIAGTGHRICNDCMKACIYQKQDPVDIPQAETRTLKDVLELPWGFEIYSLLTRWNPLHLARPLPKADTNKRVLVVGMGPAGYTLAHHLMNDGHTVVGVDGLKIEPLPEALAGEAFQPIHDVQSLYENLDERVLAGFGGVAEYGITVRWNKNFLKIIRLLLERRSQFALLGGVRFGGTITVEQAWELGFDHIALCMGAGKPTVLNIPGGMANGVRTASDFLMALQLTGAAKKDSIANLQLRLPVVVIGGGLTAIDTATESLAYYPVQVEKFLSRWEALGCPNDVWTEAEKEVAEEFIAHAKAIREARARGESVVGLLQRWGGVKMVYRRRLMDSPSYRLNHEEVQKALEEGIDIVENLSPEEVLLDASGHAEAVRFNGGVTIPARSVLV